MFKGLKDETVIKMKAFGLHKATALRTDSNGSNPAHITLLHIVLHYPFPVSLAIHCLSISMKS